jgi:hypothetical protein
VGGWVQVALAAVGRVAAKVVSTVGRVAIDTMEWVVRVVVAAAGGGAAVVEVAACARLGDVAGVCLATTATASLLQVLGIAWSKGRCT